MCVRGRPAVRLLRFRRPERNSIIRMKRLKQLSTTDVRFISNRSRLEHQTAKRLGCFLICAGSSNAKERRKTSDFDGCAHERYWNEWCTCVNSIGPARESLSIFFVIVYRIVRPFFPPYDNALFKLKTFCDRRRFKHTYIWIHIMYIYFRDSKT